MSKEANKGKAPVMDEDFYRKLRPFKKRITERYLRKYYQKEAWASQTLPFHNSAWIEGIDQTIKYPEICQHVYGLYKSAKHYFELPKVPTEGHILAFLRVYNKTVGNWGRYLASYYKGNAPKLEHTQMIKEFMARGFVYAGDVIKTFDKTKYAIITHPLPFVWPLQYDQQQDGLIAANKFGIPGFCGCPAMDQGQLALYKRSY